MYTVRHWGLMAVQHNKADKKLSTW